MKYLIIAIAILLALLIGVSVHATAPIVALRATTVTVPTATPAPPSAPADFAPYPAPGDAYPAPGSHHTHHDAPKPEQGCTVGIVHESKYHRNLRALRGRVEQRDDWDRVGASEGFASKLQQLPAV